MKFLTNKYVRLVLIVLLVAAVIWYAVELYQESQLAQETELPTQTAAVAEEGIPAYDGTSPYTVLSGNVPDFSESDWTTSSYEYYSELDALGRCGYAIASIGTDLMPTEARGSISSVKPSGWQSVQYDIVDGKSLYNRCHLIGFQLTGENANRKNLITGTRYLNVVGMLPFENMVCDYVKETENHVLYRVTPIFDGDNLVADGVQMEGWSVEDGGEGVCFNIFCYNVQPGIEIDYATGESWLGAEARSGVQMNYVLNTGTRKFHDPDCQSVADIGGDKRQDYTGSRELLVAQGYTPCGRCEP